MKRWEVRTRVTLMRYYYVDAEDEKAAETASCESSPDHEEEENEETMEISEIVAETVSLTSSERMLLEWLLKDDGQYGECHGATLDGLIAKGFVKVGGEETGLNNGFIAKGTDIMYRAVSITDSGRASVSSKQSTGD